MAGDCGAAVFRQSGELVEALRKKTLRTPLIGLDRLVWARFGIGVKSRRPGE